MSGKYILYILYTLLNSHNNVSIYIKSYNVVDLTGPSSGNVELCKTVVKRNDFLIQIYPP